MDTGGYDSYKKARDACWQFLIDNEIDRLPVDVFKLAHRNKIGTVSYFDGRNILSSFGLLDHMQETDGFTVNVGGRAVIFFNQANSMARARFTIAHELGHIVLQHPFLTSSEGASYTLINREPKKGNVDTSPLEKEANIFASRLLSPSCILWALNVTNADEIAELCCISKQSAAIRAERMAQLIDRDGHFKSPLEKQVMKQFFPYLGEKLDFYLCRAK